VNLATSSEGEVLDDPRHLQRGPEALAAAGPGVEAAGLKEAQEGPGAGGRQHRDIANRCRDAPHQLSPRLVNAYDLLVFENLAIAHMTRSPGGPRRSRAPSGSHPQGWCREGSLLRR